MLMLNICGKWASPAALARRSEKQRSGAERRSARPTRNALAQRGEGQSSKERGVEMARRGVACSRCQPWRGAAQCVPDIILERRGAARHICIQSLYTIALL